MRALITGATGQDGSYLVEAATARDWEITALVRGAVGESETPLPTGVATVAGDLGDSESLRRAVSTVMPDVIVNLGGISSVARSWDEPELTGRVTGVAVAVLLDAAWRLQENSGTRVRLVQASSSEIFGSALESPQNESTPIAAVSPYGAAKSFAHLMVESYRARGLHASSAILYNHESPRRALQFVTRKITDGAARIALGMADELVLGDRSVQRDWGWAPDYAEAMLRMAEADQPGTYVVATGVLHSLDEFVAAAFARVGIDDWDRYVRTDPRFVRPLETSTMLGDASHAAALLGWTPTVDFEEVVARMVDADLHRLTTGA